MDLTNEQIDGCRKAAEKIGDLAMTEENDATRQALWMAYHSLINQVLTATRPHRRGPEITSR